MWVYAFAAYSPSPVASRMRPAKTEKGRSIAFITPLLADEAHASATVWVPVTVAPGENLNGTEASLAWQVVTASRPDVRVH